MLETRRLERARAQERVDARANKSRGPSEGSAGSSSDSSSDDGSHQGAWAGAAAAATLAAAVAATLAATAASELTLVPRAFDDESRSSPRDRDPYGGTSSEPTRVRQTFFDAKTKEKSARLHPALDAAVAFAGGAGAVVSALGWPPGR